MWTIIGIIVIALVVWGIRNYIVEKIRESQVEFLMRLVVKSFQEGQSRKSMYKELLEMEQEKKYSEYVINEVIIQLLYPVALQYTNQGWSNPKIRETLKAAGYDEFFIERAIERARANN